MNSNLIVRTPYARAAYGFPWIVFFVLFLLLLPLLCQGQVGTQKRIEVKDYSQWGHLKLEQLSSNAQWASYSMQYDTGADTLFVRQTSGSLRYALPQARNSTFDQQNWLVALQGQELIILELSSGKRERITNVQSYAYSAVRNAFYILQKEASSHTQLLVRSSTRGKSSAIDGVTKFSISPNGAYLVYAMQNKKTYRLCIQDLALGTTKLILSDTVQDWDHFYWDKKSQAVAFLSKKNDSHPNMALYYYLLQEQKCFLLPTAAADGFPQGAQLYYDFQNKLLISDDLQRVFFSVIFPEQKQYPQDKDQVEIWNASDPQLFPASLGIQPYINLPKVAVWTPAKGRILPITSTAFPKLLLNGKQQLALISNPITLEPSVAQDVPRDYYLLNLDTGEQQLFLAKQSSTKGEIMPSPTGEYISYFKDKNWWIYTVATDTHTNLTAASGIVFDGKTSLLGGDNAFGNPGWTPHDQELLLYDQYDLWLFKADGSGYRQLTHGRTKRTQYRLIRLPDFSYGQSLYDGPVPMAYDLKKGLYLKARGYLEQSGYYLLKGKNKLEQIVYEEALVDQLIGNAAGTAFLYRQQSFETAPQVCFKKIGQASQTLYQSNPQQAKYFWGKASLFTFENSRKDILKAVLFYPAQYNPQKKYPMIVNIYSDQAYKRHLYTNPTVQSENGFNNTHYSLNDYFVLYPDIAHETQNVGASAVDCSVAAVQKVIAEGLVDPEKIGLLGHSFGGYETTYVLNKTKLFATGVAGGAITDLQRNYYSISWNYKRPQFWRFYDGTYKMNTSPLEDPELYRRNSPITYVDQLQTPLLLWSGKKDTQVNWSQSLEYYLALRQLKKKSIALFYPNGNHTLLQLQDQIDLNRRIKQWFDYYLKDQAAADWIVKGIKE
ncbi:prolyl oligopeptidase family serine peptidase [Flavobacterium sp. ST-87]|uniref:Prolyl oligopeptidase family serine peptidase n=1 Tax=Flavobacterium plantiphilum TaxID=3163297 RepID=A0ABW8XPD0_9FLAO